MKLKMLIHPAALATIFVVIGVVACKASEPRRTFMEVVHTEADLFEGLIRTNVGDPTREESALAKLAEFRAVEAAYVTRLQHVSDELNRLNREYDTTRADLDRVLAQSKADRKEMRADFLSRFIELQGTLTDDEWARVHEGMGDFESTWKEMMR